MNQKLLREQLTQLFLHAGSDKNVLPSKNLNGYSKEEIDTKVEKDTMYICKLQVKK